MGKVIKLTEEQYRKALQEAMVDSLGNTSTSVSGKQVIPVEKNANTSLDTAYKRVRDKMKNPDDPNTQYVVVDRTNSGLSTESYVISRKDLSEHRRKMIEESTTTYTVSEFLNMINK